MQEIIINFIIELFGASLVGSNSEFVSISMELQIWLILAGIVTVITGVTKLLKIKTSQFYRMILMQYMNIFSGIANFGKIFNSELIILSKFS